MRTRATQSADGRGGSAAPEIRTLARLRASGYVPRSVKKELRENAMRRIAAAGGVGDEAGGLGLLPGMVGYEATVEPQIARAILSGHDMLLLGLRGQGKTRILRSMVGLLDEWMPVIDAAGEGVEGVELREDPMAPTTRFGTAAVAKLGDATPVAWVHRSERYIEKLATPDVTIADLIGEIDIARYAEGRRMSDEATMHYGLIPRANRGLFVINELPDLAPRIQVGLFNILEERDVQVRGYAVRLNLDLAVMCSANPEDYTNRGRIVTPLKDRLGSVVRTHYPVSRAEAVRITRENAFLVRGDGAAPAAGVAETRSVKPAAVLPKPIEVVIPDVIHEIVEEMIARARQSPHISQASGVSVRASIAAMENIVSSAEIRGLSTGEKRVVARVCDLPSVVPACRGKIELMLADEPTGAEGRSTEDRLIEALLGEAVKAVVQRSTGLGDVEAIAEAFTGGVRLELGDRTSAKDAVAGMKHIVGLLAAADRMAGNLSLDAKDEQARALCGEVVLEFLYVNNRLSKSARGYTR